MASTCDMAVQNIIKINSETPEPAIISRACEILNHGGLVVAPTETRYGLLARVDMRTVVEKLFEIKGRSFEKPSAIFVPDILMLKQLAEMSKVAQKLADIFLPGPMTLVLKSKRDFGPFFTLNQMTGFRISSSPLITALISKTGQLSATSANLSGRKEPELMSEIYEQLGDRIDLYLDAGRVNNPASTVVQVINDQFRILREGAINYDRVLKAIG